MPSTADLRARPRSFPNLARVCPESSASPLFPASVTAVPFLSPESRPPSTGITTSTDSTDPVTREDLATPSEPAAALRQLLRPWKPANSRSATFRESLCPNSSLSARRKGRSMHFFYPQRDPRAFHSSPQPVHIPLFFQEIRMRSARAPLCTSRTLARLIPNNRV